MPSRPSSTPRGWPTFSNRHARRPAYGRPPGRPFSFTPPETLGAARRRPLAAQPSRPLSDRGDREPVPDARGERHPLARVEIAGGDRHLDRDVALRRDAADDEDGRGRAYAPVRGERRHVVPGGGIRVVAEQGDPFLVRGEGLIENIREDIVAHPTHSHASGAEARLTVTFDGCAGPDLGPTHHQLTLYTR